MPYRVVSYVIECRLEDKPWITFNQLNEEQAAVWERYLLERERLSFRLVKRTAKRIARCAMRGFAAAGSACRGASR